MKKYLIDLFFLAVVFGVTYLMFLILFDAPAWGAAGIGLLSMNIWDTYTNVRDQSMRMADPFGIPDDEWERLFSEYRTKHLTGESPNILPPR